MFPLPRSNSLSPMSHLPIGSSDPASEDADLEADLEAADRARNLDEDGVPLDDEDEEDEAAGVELDAEGNPIPRSEGGEGEEWFGNEDKEHPMDMRTKVQRMWASAKQKMLEFFEWSPVSLTMTIATFWALFMVNYQSSFSKSSIDTIFNHTISF
jgi:hypothetical protein